jgi:hypothetical protein
MIAVPINAEATAMRKLVSVKTSPIAEVKACSALDLVNSRINSTTYNINTIKVASIARLRMGDDLFTMAFSPDYQFRHTTAGGQGARAAGALPVRHRKADKLDRPPQRPIARRRAATTSVVATP